MTEETVAPEDFKLLCMDCANNLIMDRRLLIKRYEYERLKRVEAEYVNILEKLKTFKQLLEWVSR
jgi:hypothetical protein